MSRDERFYDHHKHKYLNNKYGASSDSLDFHLQTYNYVSGDTILILHFYLLSSLSKRGYKLVSDGFQCPRLLNMVCSYAQYCLYKIYMYRHGYVSCCFLATGLFKLKRGLHSMGYIITCIGSS